MYRTAIALSLAVALTGSAVADLVADPVTTFTDYANVNLLERWNADGTYGLNFTGTCTYYGSDGYWAPGSPGSIWETLTDATPTSVVSTSDFLSKGILPTNGYAPRHLVDYTPCSFGYQRSGSTADNRVIEFTFDLGGEVTIDRLFCTWRANNHATNNYQWLDDQGNVIVDVFDADRFIGAQWDTPNQATTGTVTTSSLTFRIYLEGAGDFVNAGLGGLGAYLASDSGQQITIDGTYNIFHQETATPTGFFNSAWTDRSLTGASGKPSGGADSCTWTFSQEYTLTGMILTQGWSNDRYLAKAKLEVSLTGEDGDWETIWFAEEYRYDPETGSYIVFDTAMDAKYVRLSWDNTQNPNTVEIYQFQLFGSPVPEPATMTLLALGGLALLRRRRA
ncbi:MAG: PEP-CTERM sorting domain-containing protein [Phycisphaerae bacterium]|nr:PEP-CTERM sorting domain-containing protein [Phycisphaerae bacterium]